MDEEEEHHKNVYAHFGLSAFHAQCLEEGLINMLSLLTLTDRQPRSRADVETAFAEHDRKTLGQLLKKALARVKYEAAMEATLNDALAKRNSLMHGYFVKRVEQFATIEGRDRMIAELKSFEAQFRLADRYVDLITTLLCKKVGITDEMLEAELVRVFGAETARTMLDAL